MPEQQVITQCLVCQAPLGSASREQQIPFCHECRKCSACGLPLGPLECKAAVSEYMELAIDEPDDKHQGIMKSLIQHPRCQTLTRPTADKDPSVLVKQSYLDWLNNFRLLCEPQMELNEQTNEKQADIACHAVKARMSFEEQYIFLRRMEAGVAHMSIAVRIHAKTIKEKLDTREKLKFEKAKQEAKTSSRPVSKPSNDLQEIVLAQFMERNEIKERKHAQKLLKLRSDAIKGFMSLGMSEAKAAEAVDKSMRERGDLK